MVLGVSQGRPALLLRPETLLACAGAALRLQGLAVHSFWFDEGAIEYGARAPQFLEGIRGMRYPPLALLTIRAWGSVVGDGDGALRLLPALLSCGSLALFARLSREWLPPRGALVALALQALSPFPIWYAQELSTYAFVEFGTLLALTGCAAFLARRGHGRAGWMGCAFGTAIATGAHYYGSLVAVSVAATALHAWRWNRLKGGAAFRLAGAAGLGVLVWVLWFATVLPEQWSSWGPQARRTLRDLVELPVRLLLVDASVIPPAWRPIGVILGLLLLAGIPLSALDAWRSRRPEATWGLLCLVLPIVVALAATFMTPPLFQPKYLTVAAPAASLVIGGGLATLTRFPLGRIVPVLAVLGCLGVSVLQKTGNRREDYRSACEELLQAWRPGDAVVAISGTPEFFSQASLRHYLRKRPEVEASIVDARRPLADPAEVLRGGGRLHVIYREAPYASPSLEALRGAMRTVHEGPLRFRIQYLIFER